MNSAERVSLEPSLQIGRVSAPLFLATKLEAFYGRGRGDVLASHDIEDLLAVIDGRPELIAEVRLESQDLRSYLAGEFTRLMKGPGFIDALPGHLPYDSASQTRLPLLLRRINQLTAID